MFRESTGLNFKFNVSGLNSFTTYFIKKFKP
jgi:hypothetical protein